MDFLEDQPETRAIIIPMDYLEQELILPSPTRPFNYTEEAVLESLYASQGNLTKAARILECPYEVLFKAIKENPIYSKYIVEVRDIRNSIRMDILEDLAMNKAIAGDTSMIKKLLDSHGQVRGYGEKHTVTVKGDVPKGIVDLLAGLSDLRKEQQPIIESTVGAPASDPS